MLLSYTFVFQICLKQEPPPGEVTNNYTVFLFAGFLPWLLFQETVTRSATTLIENSNLITKTVFPSEILPVYYLSLLSYQPSCWRLLLRWRRSQSGLAASARWRCCCPSTCCCSGLFAIGIGWIVSSLQVYLRDTAQVLTVVMTLWFWVTPIFISEAADSPRIFRFLIRLNPLALRRKSVSRTSPVLPYARSERTRAAHGLRGWRVFHRRPVFPAFEARLRRRTLEM